MDLLCFQSECQFGNKLNSVLKVASSVIVARLGAFGWHTTFLWKLLQSDVFISLDQCIINERYILHIFSQYRFLVWLGL